MNMQTYAQIETHLSIGSNIMDTNQSSIFLDEKNLQIVVQLQISFVMKWSI